MSSGGSSRPRKSTADKGKRPIFPTQQDMNPGETNDEILMSPPSNFDNT